MNRFVRLITTSLVLLLTLSYGFAAPTFVVNDRAINDTTTAKRTISSPTFQFKPQEKYESFCKGDQICYDLRVSGFTDLLSVTTFIQWDTSVIRFTAASNFNVLTPSNFTVKQDSLTNTYGDIANILLYDFNFDNDFINIPDSTTIITMCFEVVGDPTSSTLIQIIDKSSTATEIIGNTADGAGKVLDAVYLDEPTIRVTDCPEIVAPTPALTFSTIDSIRPTCKGGDGFLRLEVSGMEQEQFSQVINKNGLPFQNREAQNNTVELNNLSAGTYCIDLIAIADTSRKITKCFDLNIKATDLPSIDLGKDIDAGCVPEGQLLNVRLDGSKFTLPAIPNQQFETRWSMLGTASILPEQEARQVTTALTAGAYVFTVTMQSTECKVRDTINIFKAQPPKVQVKKTGFLGCTGALKLKQEVYNHQENYVYSWSSIDGNFVSENTLLEPMINQKGTYLFAVSDTLNGCYSIDTTVVKVDTIRPKAAAGLDKEMGCKDSFITISGVASNDNLVEWFTIDGSPIVYPDPSDQANANVTRVGTYIFKVTDPINNCRQKDTMVIYADESLPVASVKDSVIFGCGTETIILDAAASSQGPSFRYQWEDENNDLRSNNDTLSTNQPGKYLFVVTNVDNNECIADSAWVSVIDDKRKPIVSITEDLTIGCYADCAPLIATVPDGGNYSYNWTSEQGVICEGAASSTALVQSIGTYQVEVTDIRNNCTTIAPTIVKGDGTEIIAAVGLNPQIDCTTEVALLDGSGSWHAPSTSFSWKNELGVAVGNEIATEVNQPGAYILEIKDNATNCRAFKKVRVTQNKELPIVDAGETINLVGCAFPTGQRLQGTVLNVGGNVAYAWTSSTNNLVGDTTIAAPEISGVGVFTLTATNLENGCFSSDEVAVVADPLVPFAKAGDSQEICLHETTLHAEMPVGEYSGAWSTLENSMILAPNNATTNIADLDVGVNTFIWTLSSQACGAFSSDTVLVLIPALPVAKDDVFEMTSGQELLRLDLTQNDEMDGPDFTVDILEKPIVGELLPMDEGIFEFNTPNRYYGTQQIQYEICDANCLDLCDVASAKIIVTATSGIDTTNTTPNAITPNGDGMNDLFLIDELGFTPQDYPNSQIIIFNRWGDTVYSASPYYNDWNGTATDGSKLSAGTYYYILRLGAGNGKVKKGDITIINAN